MGKQKTTRDVEANYPRKRFVDKLRRLADAIESGKSFRIQVAGERVTIPPDATISVEHERNVFDEEIEFQMRWKPAPAPAAKKAKRAKKAP